MKNNISYYSHDSNSHNHWKFKVLRKRYGWSGEGKFWALNNMIADAEWCMLDLTDEGKKMAVATDLDFDPKGLDEFIQYLTHVSKLVSEKDGCITTTIVQEIFNDVASKREYQRNWKRSLSNSNHQLSNSKVPHSNIDFEQSKVKKNKENKREENTVAPAAPGGTKNDFRKTEDKKPKLHFIPPTLLQVENYFLKKMGDASRGNPWPADRCKNEAGEFFDHYTANGWVQGRGKPIKDWEAACRNWMRNGIKGVFSKPEKTNSKQFTESPPQNAAVSAPVKKPAPKLPKICSEINFLYGMFLEDKATIISMEVAHYNFLKEQMLVSFSKEEAAAIRATAIEHIKVKNLPEDETNILKFMKLFGILEFFKNLKSQARETVFDEMDLRPAEALSE